MPDLPPPFADRQSLVQCSSREAEQQEQMSRSEFWFCRLTLVAQCVPSLWCLWLFWGIVGKSLSLEKQTICSCFFFILLFVVQCECCCKHGHCFTCNAFVIKVSLHRSTKSRRARPSRYRIWIWIRICVFMYISISPTLFIYNIGYSVYNPTFSK